MSDKAKDFRPIQVFLDTKRFIEAPEPRPFGGGAKDFFAGDDAGFAEHKARLKSRLKALASGMRQASQSAGFIKVRQREVAIAKSHRPLGALFTPANTFAFVGAAKAGELVFQATPIALERLSEVIEVKAEATPRLVESKKTGKTAPRVSDYRSELGGVAEVRLHEASDKIKFSAEDAVRWLSQPEVIGGYLVELFRPDPSVSPEAVADMVRGLRQSLEKVEGGLLVRAFLPPNQNSQYGQPSLALTVQLSTDSRRLVELPFEADGRPLTMVEAALPTHLKGIRPDLNVKRHEALLKALSEQALVRTVGLPPVLETAPSGGGATADEVSIDEPMAGIDYPVVGIVDGGVSVAKLSKWKVGEAGLVPQGDRNEDHGTFIGGLICAGGILNPALKDLIEPNGCRFYDLDLFPRRELRQSYWSDLEEFFDILDEKVRVAKRDHGVRIFNLSFAIGGRDSRLAYSLAADRLDRLALANDVIFIVPSGNLLRNVSRPPWPEKVEDVASMLASITSDDHHLTAPSEHLLGITVGAVNPFGIPGHIPLMPTTYTRRGPGVGGARKPDLAHFGGVEAAHTGLVSLTPEGDSLHGCGTSYATTFPAGTVATLDQRLARLASRETLLMLPVHRAKRPEPLEHKKVSHISREFVGFGIAPTADALLQDDPHSVTLVFSERLLVKQELEFPFTWPRSLVFDSGKCRGTASVTLSYTPPIDPDHGEEAVRVQLEAVLYQENAGKSEWDSRLVSDAVDSPRGTDADYSPSVKAGLKWSPIKRYRTAMPSGRGSSSNWKLCLKSSIRAGAAFPSSGVPFTLALTIADPKDQAPVREEMRVELQGRGLTIADITLAHQVRVRA